MAEAVSPEELQAFILDRIDAIVSECEEKNRPLELDPARNNLFELFVKADAAGLTGDEAVPDLSADGLCGALSERWGLKAAAQSSGDGQPALSREHMAKMRSLWGVMRMWMEWTYAWRRWSEFHQKS